MFLTNVLFSSISNVECGWFLQLHLKYIFFINLENRVIGIPKAIEAVEMRFTAPCIKNITTHLGMHKKIPDFKLLLSQQQKHFSKYFKNYGCCWVGVWSTIFKYAGIYTLEISCFNLLLTESSATKTLPKNHRCFFRLKRNRARI